MRSRTGMDVTRSLVLSLFAGLSLSVAGAAETPATPAPAGGGVVVLNNDSYLRGFKVFRTPVQVSKDGKVTTCQEPVAAGKESKPLPEFQSPLPPADWMKPEFEDSSWERQRAPVEQAPTWQGGFAAMHSATVNSLICLRWKFVVDAPDKVQDLACSLEYVGGVALYVNGHEVKRMHLPEGELKPDTLAEKYPDDLYCQPGNKFLSQRWPGDSVVKELQPSLERRYRKVENVAIPAKLLQKGVNVLALQIYRAPINEAVLTTERFKEGGMSTMQGMWAYAGLKELRLTAPAGSTLAANTSRPKGVQVWNCAPFDTITSYDYGDGGDPMPVVVPATRNGVFSGRLVVSSGEAIKGLRATVSDLTQAGGKIPAAAVRVRCATAAVNGKSWMSANRFDGLMDVLPAEIPVVKAGAPRENYLCVPIERKSQSSGAVAPLWLTVRVPKDAKPGRYEGTVTLAAEGLASISVPLRVDVSDWSLPDPRDFHMHNFAYHSEDALARHYGVPMWSDKHFELMGKSLALMAEVNSRQAIVNMCINFYGGDKGAIDCSNEQSMIRWIKQADGSWKYDFSIFDKYLDVVAKSIVKPDLLRLNCWGEQKATVVLKVTQLDPATGKVTPMEPPRPATDEALAFWKPVLDEARKKIEARGWFDVTAVGHNSYCYAPTAPVVDMYSKIWSDGAWSYTAHNGTFGMKFAGTTPAVSMRTRQADSVWTCGTPKARGYRAMLQPRPNFWCFTWRTMMRDDSPLTLLRGIGEDEIMRGQDGVSDFGADLFPVKTENGDRYYCLGNGRGTGGPGCSTLAMLAPGADGPIATERFEMLREGMQLAEVILFVQQALDGKKVTGDLETKANRLLDERGESFLKNWSAGRFARDQQLLALAGEVAKTAGQK